jgi:hypothetical protein
MQKNKIEGNLGDVLSDTSSFILSNRNRKY